MSELPSVSLSILRRITNELRKANPKLKPLSLTPPVVYLMKEYRTHQITEKRACKSSEELQNKAKTYLCYLQSLRQNEELLNCYHAKGERSVEETASLLGFKLPSDPKEDPSKKDV